jgi:hypothetical protein
MVTVALLVRLETKTGKVNSRSSVKPEKTRNTKFETNSNDQKVQRSGKAECMAVL